MGTLPSSFANILDRVSDRLGIAGTIREENAVGLQREHVCRRSLRRHDGNVAAVIHEQAQNILLDAEIVGHHAMALGFCLRRGFAHGLLPRRDGQIDGSFGPIVRFLASDAAREFEPGHRGQRARLGNQLFCGRAVGGHHAAQRADTANMAHQRARVDIPDQREFCGDSR